MNHFGHSVKLCPGPMKIIEYEQFDLQGGENGIISWSSKTRLTRFSMYSEGTWTGNMEYSVRSNSVELTIAAWPPKPKVGTSQGVT